MRKILPSITTVPGSFWKKKLKNTSLKEVAVFPTFLEERKEFYDLLEKSKVKSIPFVHLRGDMELWELDYFVQKYQTEIFNIHSKDQHPILNDFSKYKNIIYIENHKYLSEKEINNFAGICLDLSHLEESRLLNKKKYQANKKILKKYKIGCNHISAIKKNLEKATHFLNDLSELDYLKKYPSCYFSNFIALEFKNSLEEQLKIKKYLEKII